MINDHESGQLIDIIIKLTKPLQLNKDQKIEFSKIF
jgi:hypothetical protein